MASEAQLFEDLVTNKIDVFFAEPAQAHRFLTAKPGSIRNVAAETPLTAFANVFVMPTGETQFKQMIDVALADLQNSGFVEAVIRRYESPPGALYRVAPPYLVDLRGHRN